MPPARTVFIPSTLYAEEEMNYLINDADPAMIILDPDSSVAATIPVETIGVRYSFKAC